MREWEFHLLEDASPLDELVVRGRTVRKGDRVRLRPRAGGDAFDLMLSGQTAVVASIEQDYENRLHVSVVLEDDPGRDAGFMKQPGHRFFFAPEEVEPLENGAGPQPSKTVLVAGVGNIFQGDDAFGVEVARRMGEGSLPPGVRVVDFGIRGFDLAYALTSGYDLTILIDACPRGRAPGTVYVIEPELPNPRRTPTAAIETHGMNPVAVLHLAQQLGGTLKRVLLVGCEPETLESEDGRMGLSETVAASLDKAIEVIQSLIHDFLEKPEKLSQPVPGD